VSRGRSKHRQMQGQLPRGFLDHNDWKLIIAPSALLQSCAPKRSAPRPSIVVSHYLGVGFGSRHPLKSSAENSECCQDNAEPSILLNAIPHFTPAQNLLNERLFARRQFTFRQLTL
jgi:hypothetical protein